MSEKLIHGCDVDGMLAAKPPHPEGTWIRGTKWRCPVCRQRWQCTEEWEDGDRRVASVRVNLFGWSTVTRWKTPQPRRSVHDQLVHDLPLAFGGALAGGLVALLLVWVWTAPR